MVIDSQIIVQKSVQLGISKIAIKKISDISNQNLVSQVKNLFPNGKVIISSCLNYNDDNKGNILQYTRINYYRVLSKMLHKLAKYIKNLANVSCSDGDFFRTSVNSVLNDKICATECGLGSFCTNHLVYVQDVGIKTVLGQLIVDFDCGNFTPENLTSCNNCKLCIKSCPTGALSETGVNKSLCLQHNSHILDFNENLIDFWGDRFFGCDCCIKSCHLPNKKSELNLSEQTGFIGSDFDIGEIFNFKKGDYKNRFRANQLAATWMEEIVHPRNILLNFYGRQEYDKIEKYKNEIDNFNWNEEEKKYLLHWCNILLIRSKK